MTKNKYTLIKKGKKWRNWEKQDQIQAEQTSRMSGILGCCGRMQAPRGLSYQAHIASCADRFLLWLALCTTHSYFKQRVNGARMSSFPDPHCSCNLYHGVINCPHRSCNRNDNTILQYLATEVFLWNLGEKLHVLITFAFYLPHTDKAQVCCQHKLWCVTWAKGAFV